MTRVFAKVDRPRQGAILWAIESAGARLPGVDSDCRGADEFPFLAQDSLVGFPDQSSQFRHPVFIGDTLYPTLEIDELTPNQRTGVIGLAATVHNQTGQLVTTGRQRYLVRRPPD